MRGVRNRLNVVAASIVLVLVLIGCAAPATREAPTEQPTTGAPTEEPTTGAPTEESATDVPTEEQPAGPSAFVWQADGIISDREYAHEATIGEVAIWWQNDAEFLYLAMEASTAGWVAVGLDPVNRMEGANYLLGAVVDGQARVWDAYGTAPTGATHPPDEELGGTNDIVAFAGVEEAGVTRFEVQIPLDSGDEFDKPLEPGGTYPVITAVGSSDAFDVRHSARGGGTITLD